MKTNNNNLISSPIWVVKIGGSLLGSAELKQWLDAIVQYSDGRVVIVPGGSVFAEAVREAQMLSEADDATAHHLALLAMDQFGLLLASMNDALVTARNELEIAERAWQHRAIVWLPSEMVLAEESIAQNWQVTSDSLSAWLASKLNADHLVIVKSALVDDDGVQTSIAIESLIEAEIVDEKMVDFVIGQTYQTWIMHKADHDAFEAGFEVATLEEYGLLVDIKTH